MPAEWNTFGDRLKKGKHLILLKLVSKVTIGIFGNVIFYIFHTAVPSGCYLLTVCQHTTN